MNAHLEIRRVATEWLEVSLQEAQRSKVQLLSIGLICAEESLQNF